MSEEQLTTKDLNKTSIDNLSKKVNINNLLAKVRQEKNKEKKDNLIFVGLICGAIVATGVIASF